LESVHDNMHDYIGGAGHMGDADVAAFDPIFYLHHANIDRLIALWQAINPGVWTAVGDGTKDLKPFRDPNDSFWNSNKSYKYSDLNYTYPEFLGLENSTQEAIKRAIRDKVERLYNPLRANTDPHGYDWTIRVHCKKYELGGSSFQILIFLGEPPADPEQWFASPNYVASHAIFARSGYRSCSNCMEHEDNLIESILHLNSKIEELAEFGISPFHPDIVKPYLTKQLHWRVLKVDGTVVDVSDLPSLEIIPVHRALDPDGTVDNPVLLPEITHGRPGGAKRL